MSTQQLDNPLPGPKRRPHREMEFDLSDEDIIKMEKARGEDVDLSDPAPHTAAADGGDKDSGPSVNTAEDDFDFKVSDDDDFDI
ncbi:MAG: hypothetical protein PUC46_08085 [Lachnospiraceae bacterium]|jgi:hypothetical protein|nr:hypothetical protein [Lachnospiraceae bacterium]